MILRAWALPLTVKLVLLHRQKQDTACKHNFRSLSTHYHIILMQIVFRVCVCGPWTVVRKLKEKKTNDESRL